MPVPRTWEEYDRALRLARNSAAYKRNRAKVLAPNPLWCALCGGLIDKTVHYLDPWAPVCDHRVSVSDGGDPVNLSNLQAAHRRCNEIKEAERRAALDGRTARPFKPAVRPMPTPAASQEWITEEP